MLIIRFGLRVVVQRLPNVPAARAVGLLRRVGDGTPRSRQLFLGFIDEVLGCALLVRA